MNTVATSVAKHIKKHYKKGVHVVVEGENGCGKGDLIDSITSILNEEIADAVISHTVLGSEPMLCKLLPTHVMFYEKTPARVETKPTNYNQSCTLIRIVFNYAANSSTRNGRYHREENHSIAVFVDDGVNESQGSRHAGIDYD